ncbi:DUF4386 family protein [Paenibacillus kobensis]|uniref:DUF4386 family protein n=1 Tax=Paenibacillus kobensis TaxID=59841 RepID=UPI000FD7BA9C|nr:DUF4386 family protein [Paenibacillus kobensis]
MLTTRSLNSLTLIGGIAALINAFAYIVGIGLVFTYLSPVMNAETEEYVKFIADHQTLMFVWHLLIYLIAGVTMVPLALALHERLKHGSPAGMMIATSFGLIWVVTVISSGMIIVNDLGVIADLYSEDPTRASTVWLSLSAVEEGLGGAIELPGGLWILLVSGAALRSDALPKTLNIIGIIIGTAGILTVVPALYSAGYVFGLGAIAWFIGAGIALLRSRSIN